MSEAAPAGKAFAAPDGAAKPPLVDIADLRKSYGSVQAVKGVSLAVRRGEAQFVIGPSGCGKSTLLRCLNLLEEPSGGSLRVGETSIAFGKGRRLSVKEQARFRGDVGMVFQQFHLFPHMTALQNVMEGPITVRRMPRNEAAEWGESLLAKVGLSEKRDVMPRHLSGGQAQRVAIARALAMSPSVMLLDEVTSALDPELVGEVLAVIRQLTQEGMTMIIVTHEMGFAREVAHEVAFMDEGLIVERGPPSEVLDRPKSLRLQAFLRRFRTAQG
ncbi:MAG: amino acid ABC transporter ATP-binding protein [Alphaproteobacteria bacterium]